MKRRVAANMNSQNKSKVVAACSKHSKIKGSLQSNRSHSHTPTLRCHEEIMSKQTICQNTDCIGEPFSCSNIGEYKEVLNKVKSRVMKNNKVRSYNTLSKECYESASVPISPELHSSEFFPRTMKSKSVPTAVKPNLEESVDFIPVKLLPNNDKNPRRQKQKVNTKIKSKENSSRSSCRATWDKVLRSQSQELPLSNQLSENVPKLRIDESSTNTPRKRVLICDSNIVNQQDNVKMNSSESSKPFNQFYVSDPVKTLDILIKQLREKSTKQQNEDLHNIIMDMENALLKISVENQAVPKSVEEKQTCSSGGFSTNTAPKSDFSDISGTRFQGENGRVDVAQLERNLRESCIYLQSLCIKQKENCNNHLQEKEQLTLQLAESRRLLAIAKSREKDYEVTIGELRLKIQEANSRADHKTETEQELFDTVEKLRIEKQMLESFKEAVKKLNARLRLVSQEKEILRSKLSLKELETEKLKVLLEVKENLNPVLKHNRNEVITGDIDADLHIPVEDKENSLISLSASTSLTEGRPGLIICSSQTSGSPGRSPSPYNSWQHISSIYQRPSGASELNKGIAEIFRNLKKETEQNQPPQLDLEIPSSGNSLWSDQDDLDLRSKIIFSDGESGSMSS